MENEYCVGLNDLLEIFEENLSASDIISSKVLGEISAAIVKRRIESGMTQKQFAQYMGVSQGMVSRWESADYNFSVKSLAEIASKLDLNLKIHLYKSETVEISEEIPLMGRIIAYPKRFYVFNNQKKTRKYVKQYIENTEPLQLIINEEDTKCCSM